jgi:hypothetical protein
MESCTLATQMAAIHKIEEKLISSKNEFHAAHHNGYGKDLAKSILSYVYKLPTTSH